ncbi:Protein of unknown function DUF414 CDS [Salmonella enterica subsp. enterica serovar Derby]|nr:Protein of unknown function DUF414 CDS [Salmonella enterica subsp. enterica serovar Derby]
MKKPTSAPRSKAFGKQRRKTREELNQEARDRKRLKKHRGHAPRDFPAHDRDVFSGVYGRAPPGLTLHAFYDAVCQRLYCAVQRLVFS